MSAMVYTLNVTITRPIRPDANQTATEETDWMRSPAAARELEREVLRALRKLDGDCDCEVLDAQVAVEVA